MNSVMWLFVMLLFYYVMFIFLKQLINEKNEN